jgi:hypothetical protein
VALDDGAQIDPATIPENISLMKELDAHINTAAERRERQRALAALIADVVPEAASRVEQYVVARGADHAKEEDLRGGVAELLREGRELVLTEARLAVPGWTRNLGGFDLAVVADNSVVVAETKWADGNLAECLWDLFKLGCALEIPRVDAAEAIYGAPVKHWQKPAGVTRLFEDRDVVGKKLIEGLPRDWAWNLAGSNAEPGAVPMLMKLRLLNATPVSVVGREWEVRTLAVYSESGVYHLQGGWPHGAPPAEPQPYDW